MTAISPELLRLAREAAAEEEATVARLSEEIAVREDALRFARARLDPLTHFLQACAQDETPPAPVPPVKGHTHTGKPAKPPRAAHDEPAISVRCGKCRRFLPPSEFVNGGKLCTRCRGVEAAPGWPADLKPDPVAEAVAASESTDFEPVEATYDVVARWAGQRGIAFASWEDLPRVNNKREEFKLPRFKRKMGGKMPGRISAGMAPL
jgi:hypothetical protein